jgi:hypothetical protein
VLIVTSLRSRRKWFVFHNWATEHPSVQFVLSGCHTMPSIQYIPVDLPAGNYPSEVEVNGTSPSSAVAENAWR